jgi:hypothetical protein
MFCITNYVEEHDEDELCLMRMLEIDSVGQLLSIKEDLFGFVGRSSKYRKPRKRKIT